MEKTNHQHATSHRDQVDHRGTPARVWVVLRFVVVLLFCLVAAETTRAAIRTFSGSGNFSTPARWDGGVTIPSAGDDIVIAASASCTIDTAAAKSFGNVTVNNLATLNNSAANAPVSISKSLVNNGTYTAGTGSVTFTGATSNTITGTATTAFGNGGLIINKGASTANVLDVQSVISIAGTLTLTNGVFKLSSASTLTVFNGNITIPASAGLWCNAAGASMTTQNGNLTVAGLLEVTAGTLTVGTQAANLLIPASTGSIVVGGGNLNVAGNMSNAGVSWTFSMTAGTMTLNTNASAAGGLPFNMDTTGCSFSMSGGTIVVQQDGTGSPAFNNLATAGTGFTGGLLQIGNASTPASQIIGITSTRAIYALSLNNAGATAQLTTSALVVTTDVTITAGVLNANNLNLTVGGTWTNNAATTAFTAGSGTMTMNGAAAENIAGTFATTFNNLTIAGSNVLTSSVNCTVSSNLTVTSGTLDLAAFTANRVTSGGTLTVADGATLKIGGTNGFPTNYGSPATLGSISTVEYSGTAQAVGGQNYGHLTLSNSGLKTFGTVAASNIRIAGALTISGTATTNLTTNTTNVSYNGSGAQTILGLTYYDLTASTSGTKTLAANAIVNNSLKVDNSAILDLSSFTANRASGGGTLTLASTARLKIGGTNTLPSNYTTHSIAATTTIEYSGANQSVAVLNSAQDYGHLVISGSGTKTLAGTENVAGNLTISAGTFDLGANTINRTAAGGTLALSSGAALKIGGTNTIPTNYTTHSIGATSTIEYNGTTQSVIVLNSAQNYGNLTISGTLIKTLAATISVASDLTVSGGTFDLGSFTADRASAGAGTLSVANTATLKIGGTNTFPANYSTHSLGATSTVEYSGSNQSLAVLNIAPHYANLTISGSGTKTLAGDVNVAATLLFTNGTITTGANTLFLIAGGTVTRVSGHVIGNFKKNVATGVSTTQTFEVGDASNYTPATFVFANVTTAGNLIASVVSGDHANIGTSTINAAKSVNRNWTLTNGATVFGTYDATFTFVAGDVDGGASTAAFIVGEYNAGWTYPTVGTKTALTTQTTGVTTFGDFQLGEAAVTKTWDGGAGTNNWGDALNWNADGVPISTDNVNLAGANTININVAAVANNITLNNAALVLTINPGSSLAVSGALTHTAGTFNMGTNTVSGAGSFTLGAGGNLGIGSTAGITSSGATGNVQVTGTRTFSTAANYNYNGTSAQVTGNGLPATVNNLTANNSAGVTLSANVVVSADLTVTTGTLDLSTFTANRGVSGGTLTISNSATLKIGGTNTIPSNYNAHSIGSTSTIQYSGTTQSVVVLNSAQNYGNLTISGSATKTLAATISVAGDLLISGSTFDLGGFTANRASAGGTLTLAVGAATLKIGGTNTFPTNYSTHSIGSFTTVEYAGTNQSVAVLNSSQDYNALTISGSGTKTLAGDVNVAGMLTLGSGTVTTGANTLYINNFGNVSRVSGWVIGNFKRWVSTGAPLSRTWFVGDATNYTPVVVAAASVSTAGALTVSTTAGDHANIGTSIVNAAKSVNRTWTLTNSGIVYPTYDATFTFVAGDVDGIANTANFTVGKYSGGWTSPAVGLKTAVSTQATGMSTFGDFQLGELGLSVSGTVFEDMNYGGGAGRSLAASSGSARPTARVELFDSGGTYQTFTTTDGSGNYTFSGLAAGTYTVRATNASVTTSRGVLAGTTPTQTFRTNASSGTAVAVTDHVGGEVPGLIDAVDGSTTLAALTTGATTPQSITSVVLSSGNITGVDFGYSFNVVVNANNQSQGSLRRVLIFANAISNTGLAQSGMTAGIDNVVFMLADGTARPGLTASYATQFAGGVATIALAASYPTISDPIVIDATLQPGYTGVPMIELNGAGAGAGTSGITITAGGSTVRGFAINRFTAYGISLSSTGSNTVAANYLGTNASGTTASANTTGGINLGSASNTIGGTTAATRNIISGNGADGIDITGSSNIVQGNYIGTNAAGNAALANGGNGIYVSGSAASNSIGGTAAGAGNLIADNTGKGIVIAAGTGNAIRSNSTYGNTGIGIDLTNDGVTANDGTKSGALANFGMDTPVFTTVTLSGTTLTISGYVGSAASQATFAGASVEVFKSDIDSSGFGEGQTYLGTLTADGSGNLSGTVTVSLAIGDKITGTATDAGNNTSEFGANATVTNPTKTWDGGAGTNNWGDAANWNADGVPISTDNVDLTGANTININVAAVANNLLLNNAALVLTINAGSSLAVSSSLTLTAGTLNMGTNTVSGAGSFTLGAGGNLGIGSTAGITSSGATGNVQVSGTRTFGTGANYTYNGSAAQVTGNGLPPTVNNLTINNSAGVTLSATVAVSSDLTVTAGTLDLGSFTANRVSAGGTLTVSNGAGLKIGGTNGFPTNYSTNSLGITSTVDYSGTAQAVGAQNYGHLTLSNSGVKTFAAGTEGIAGTFTISGTATANMTANSPTVDYNGSGSQTILAQTYYNLTASNAGTKTLAGNTIVNNNLAVSNPATLDLSSFTANRASPGGTLTVSNGATLKIGGTNTLPSNYSTHSIGATSTVEYSGTTQSVAVLTAQDYGHLVISGSGTKTLAGTENVAGNLTISAATFDLGANTINRTTAGGTLTVSNGAALKIGGTNTFPTNYTAHSIGATSTIEYGGTNQSVVALNSAQDYGNLIISGSGTKTLAGTENVAGDLTISAGTFDLGANTINRTAAGGTLTLSSGAALKIGGTNTFPSNYTAHSIAATSTVEYSGTTQSVVALNSSQDYGNLIISGSATKTLAGAENAVGNLTISAGIFSANNLNMAVGGNWTNNAATTGFTAGTGTITLNGSSAQALAGSFVTTFNNLTISNTGNTVTSGVNSSVSSNLSVSSGTFDLGAFTADRASAGAGTLSVAGGATLKIGGTNTLPSNYLTHSISATSTVEYSGTNQGLAVLNSSQDYGNLTISGSGTKTLTGSESVVGTLTFTSGTITTGANALYVTSTGTVSRTSGHVIGNFKKNVATGATSKTFEVGDASNYTPVTVAFASVTTAGDLTASVALLDHANIGGSTINASKSVNRNWTLTNSGVVFTAYGATFTFVPGDVDGTANTAAFIVGKYSAGWTYPTVGTKNPTNTQTTGVTTFGDFQLGEATVTKTWDGGAGTNNWGDANNWNTNVVPISSDNVDLTGANTININVAAVATNLLLNNAGLVLTINPGSSLAVSGSLTQTAGTFNMGTNIVSGAGSFTLGAGGNLGIGSTAGITTSGATGNVQVSGTRTFSTGGNYTYNGTSAQVTGSGLPATVNNLTINNSAGVTLTASVAVSSDLTVTVGTLDLGSFTANRVSAGGTLSVANGAGLKIGGTNTLPSGYSAHSIGATSTIEYSGTTQSVAVLNSSQNYGNLTISGSATKSLVDNATVAGTLTLTAGTLSIGANTLTINGAISTASGTLTGGGSSNLTIGGAGANTTLPAVTLNNMNMNRANGLSLGGNVTVGGALTFTSGNITTGTNALYISSTGSVSRTSGYVIGNFKKNVATGVTSRTFEIGDATNYIPVTLSFGSVTTAGDLTASTAAADHGNIGTSHIDAANSVNRNWTLTNSGIVFTNYDATFTFVAGDIDAGTNTTLLGVDRYNGGSWTYTTLGARTTTSTQATGVTAFGDFQIGNMAASGTVPALGSAITFAVLAGTTVTSTGLTVVSGNIGVSPGTAVTGFPPGVIQNGQIYSGGGSLAGPAEASALTAYNNLVAQPCLPANNLSGMTLGTSTGAITLRPGVYCFGTSAGLTSTLNLDDGGDPNAIFIFQMGTTLTTAAGSQVVMSSGGRGPNVFWQVGSSATIGASTALRGNVIAYTSITVTTSAGTAGRLFALNGAVTMDTNAVDSVPAGTPPNISGNVFEDKNYGGGAGRSLASSSGVARASVRVELFDSGGTYQTFTTTDGSGNYSLGTLPAGTYTVRVVNSTVTSSRGGSSLLPVQTFRTNAGSGAAVAVADHVGGETPGLADAGNGSTTLAALTTGTTTAQSITSVVLSSSNITSVDFGYSFNVIVNKNDAGQGSVRQFLTNANALSNTGLAQSGLTSGKDNAVFMLADGTARAGLTASYATQFASSIASITLASALPTITDPVILDAGLQPGYTSSPMIELNGTSAGAGTNGLTITAGGSTVRGLVINRFTAYGISISTTGSNTIAANYLGTNATGTSASANTTGGINLSSSSNTIGGTTSAARNIVSGNGANGIDITGSSNIVQGNYIGTNAAGSAAVANSGVGVYASGSAASNSIGGTAAGAGNLISGNTGKGVVIAAGTGNAILSNSIYGNAGIGIDLTNDGVTVNDGTKSGALANSGMDTPVFTTRSLVGSTLTLAGYVGSAAGQSTFASASVEVFKSDIDGSGYGEGQTYLGTLTTDASGNFSGSLTVSGLVAGDRITGTATDGTNNTSEFGRNVSVSPPAVSLSQSVLPNGTQPPGTDLVFSFVFTNGGGVPAGTYIIIDPIPPSSDFKVASATSNLGTTGLTITVAYSNDSAATWTYTPVSGGGGALPGYDRAVTHVRWSFTGNLSQTSPNNTGSVTLTTRIR